jgi:hypothetical protein
MQTMQVEQPTNNFSTLQVKLQEHVASMVKDVDYLFVVDVDKDKLWELYLGNFPQGTNPVYRQRTEHDCSTCRHFIKSFGNVIRIKNNVITTIWDFDMDGSRYGPVVKTLATYVRSCPVVDVLVTDLTKFGITKNFEKSESGDVTAWEHFYVELPERFKTKSRATLDTVRGKFRDVRNVFKRSLDEISQDAVLSVLELIASNSLYKGEEWKDILEAFQKHQVAYSKLNPVSQEVYTWEQSVQAGPVIGKIRNHSIGVLLVDISNGVDLDGAVRKYEAIVAPTNYKRPKAIFTKHMLEQAEQTITELGYLESLGRQHAVLDDITVNNILFANRDTLSKISGGNIFKELSKEIAANPKSFDRIEEVSIGTFVTDILPTAQFIEVLLENKHAGNLVSLIAPANKNAPTMFKWSNNFSWAYAGNITDAMKQRVKAAGGNVDGVLRFSIQWGPGNENDFDAHCIEPGRNEIYFINKGRQHRSSGMLDVDIVMPSTQTSDGIAVENITWTDTTRMPEGTYQLFVHNYNNRGGRDGFTAEVEFDGQIYSFAYNKELKQGEKVPVADVTYSKSNGFKIVEKIPSQLASRKLWNLDTNQFQPVSVIMMSPNYWDGQDNVGNRHYFFMLKECINTEQPNGFFNEYLKQDLLEHKRVFEALGSKMRVVASGTEQLSGLGFSSTQRNAVVVKVSGHVNRTLKVIF